ncbi:MAG: tRNA (adenosine(37)-N6)-threonylcarbamoyltransferase complex transferase subunit TsaD [Candidatus Zambryskibacteria bacterium RIFCSPLOWO2_02_FULL_51_21]|uniref:tRNA N6-adenosine threonylcarbamoyltransferase n=1 Tax=Candidatus Zambryskibacteria bacterium RIFCSPHIGHO2_02_FULL_43_37 TaxID=1802749 RepID=A0A1G2TI68_9BACT|nr:MAG: tRNA (adenosine(37)-N6)-threonylcarbamoyltransferase complex transferase subunit TsaD [Candidatus Zambryskibacteria bacterium RIFCSPHIGHO2_01_FULL_52_18]OHA96893.1 MAG: tRNA (adenosine(37)-N6)-threonylcarbamoyltransferase complex transferase subunit TsaD [Candidatus Zambryskibacteria bacterium RIFCSPHIGHO2_02_FULL_43_37]OHB07050.1 MAG: tRNA (adenosine(37)-N6)-threonylcarbamoyltransferase complex transferase subunit TsaD [Candidatus Zambryskibacteria bacterium RIFCSPLOWO2_01_FULL_52_12]OH
MKILSIETSCDETAVALLDITGPLSKPDIKILGNTLLSQVPLHEQYGGVFPALAKREHQKNLPVLLGQTLKEAGITSPAKGEMEGVDFIAVTAGPGLEPALWAGIVFAEELSKKWQKPVIGVDHMKGHIWSVLFGGGKVELPALALLVSGGHTELVLVRDFDDYEILGRTLDDAVGEAFDKVARMLGLHYPGGPKISTLADISRNKKQETNFKFPRPMINSGDLNFSYSGLKTAVLYKIRDLGELSEELKEDIARAFEDAAIEVLVEKTRKALETTDEDIKTLIVAGGVSANKLLGEKIAELAAGFPGLILRLPERSFTTDNAVMIGIAAYIEASKNPSILKSSQDIKASGNLSISSRPSQ